MPNPGWLCPGQKWMCLFPHTGIGVIMPILVMVKLWTRETDTISAVADSWEEAMVPVSKIMCMG